MNVATLHNAWGRDVWPESVKKWVETLSAQPRRPSTDSVFTDTHIHEHLVSYRCTLEGEVDMSSVVLLDDSVSVSIGDIIEQDSDGYVVIGKISLSEQCGTQTPRFGEQVMFVAAMSTGAKPAEILLRLLKIAKPYYPITDALKEARPLSTFMSVNAVLDVATQTVVGFDEVSMSYAQCSDSSALIRYDEARGQVVFKAYIANGGFNVAGKLA